MMMLQGNVAKFLSLGDVLHSGEVQETATAKIRCVLVFHLSFAYLMYQFCSCFVLHMGDLYSLQAQHKYDVYKWNAANFALLS